MDKHIVGTCLLMCPLKETQLREREGLLHKFERLEDSSIHGESLPKYVSVGSASTRTSSSNQHAKFSNRQNGRSTRPNLPRANRMKTVKCFSRSAAGMDKTCPDDLRPGHVLEQTVYYLCTDVLTKTNESAKLIYDFIFDRLRSVRQDLVIQRITDRTAIRILEAIVNFHVYAAYRCRDEPVQNFDPHINSRHLIDCLKRLINLYEINEYWGPSRSEFEALYVIVCPDSSEVLSRAISIRDVMRSPAFSTAVQMSLAYQLRNYVKYFRKAQDLPPLLVSYIVQHTRHMRSIAYQVISFAYGNKSCKFPLRVLSSTLLYNSVRETELNLSQIGVELISYDNGDKYARFCKPISPETSLKLDQVSYELNLPSGNIMVPENINFIAKEFICPWKDVGFQTL